MDWEVCGEKIITGMSEYKMLIVSVLFYAHEMAGLLKSKLMKLLIHSDMALQGKLNRDTRYIIYSIGLKHGNCKKIKNSRFLTWQRIIIKTS